MLVTDVENISLLTYGVAELFLMSYPSYYLNVFFSQASIWMLGIAGSREGEAKEKGWLREPDGQYDF